MMTEEVLRAYLNTLKVDMDLYRDSIREVSDDIISGGYSEYPVFIAHQEEVKLGEVILDRDELQTNFTIQASTLEELLERNIIMEKNASKFKSAYKDPKTHCCIFLVTRDGAQFVFVPYESPKAPPTENDK